MLHRPAPVLHDRPAHRPRLRPRTPVVWRSATTLQIGISDPVVVTHEDTTAAAATARLVSGLDGARAWADLMEHDALLMRLARHGLLEDAAIPGPPTDPERRARAQAEASAWSGHWRSPDAHEALTRRTRARVDVVGDGRLASAVATLLTASGVTVRMRPGPRSMLTTTLTGYDLTPWGPHLTDHDPSRDQATAAMLEHARIHTLPRMRADAPPTLVVLAHDAVGPDPSIPAFYVEELVRQRIPHLPVVASDTRAQIGPWYLHPGDPCVRCLDLHRSDADPAWPAIAAHLARPRSRDHASVPVAVAALAGAHAALTVLAHLDADQHARGEIIRLAATQQTHEQVQVHPQCGCDGRRAPMALETTPVAVPRTIYPSMAHARRRSQTPSPAPTGTLRRSP